MGAVQRAVFRLNEPEKLDAFLKELGRKHVGYGANVEYIDVSIQLLSLVIDPLRICSIRRRLYILHVTASTAVAVGLVAAERQKVKH